MKHIVTTFSLLCLVILSSQVVYAQLKVQNLRVLNLDNPQGIDVKKPRFSWQLVDERRNIMQSAYELHISAAQSFREPIIWNSGKVNSDSSVHVVYKGQPLSSRTKYYWRVRVWDNKNKVSAWSPVASFSTAYLNIADWKAKWIQPGFDEDTILRPSPLLRKEFSVGKAISSAVINITAHGLYEAAINGKRIGDAYLTPGWTSYNKRLQYQTYDVTSLLKQGPNALGVTLGSGWYRGIIGFENKINVYGKDVSLLLQLDVTYTDGTTETVISDESWKSTTGSILYSEIYHGETIDARKERAGWTMPGYDTNDWKGVRLGNFGYSNLIATCNEPIRKQETFKPKKIFTTPKGEKVIDFGQNLVGWVVLKVKGNAGDTVKIFHAEVLDKEGNFYTENLRAAKSRGTYILKGGAEETFEPHFTFHGFQFVKLEGYPGELKPENFTAVALYSDMPVTGSFKTSNALINQLQHNIAWGQRGNFLDVPTDCPQRDERLGWTGDAQAFSRTAAFNMGVNNFFSKWMQDVSADQRKDGSVPWVIPDVLHYIPLSSAGWSDAATIIPWNMYLAYGDRQILAKQYQGMKAWVEYQTSQSTNDLWNKGFHFGDWLFYRPFDDNDGRAAVTDKYLIAQCFYAHSVQLMINTANVLGYKDDAARYTELLKKIKDAFQKEYVTPSGRLVSGTQTAYVLALNFDMLTEALREQAARRLVENIQSYGHLTTGFLGTPYLCHVLSRFGYNDEAFKLLLNEKYPSWLYPVNMGATTIWERWDGIKPDSTFQTPGMNSYNHYAYGAIGDWMYRIVGGLDTDTQAPGYKHIIIKPTAGGGFTSVETDLQTNYGLTACHWRKTGDEMQVAVTIPPNTTADILLPAKDVSRVSEGRKLISANPDIKLIGNEGDYTRVALGSGTYHFTIPGEK